MFIDDQTGLPTATTLQALKVVVELKKYIEDNNSSGTIPGVEASIGIDELVIRIAGMPVWHSDENSDDELTVPECLFAYKQELNDLMSPVLAVREP